MHTFLYPLSQLAEYGEIREKLKKETGIIQISGCVESQKAQLAFGLSDLSHMKLIVAENDLKAQKLYEDYCFFDREVLLYPARDLIFYQADIHGNLTTRQRMQVIRGILENRDVTVITSITACMEKLMPIEAVAEAVLTLDFDHEWDPEELKTKLAWMGYERVSRVEMPGQFSIRGGILDIFPLTEDNPVRIEMWGDEVDTIRSFDVESQKSIENLEELVIYPACELVLDDEEKQAGIARFLKEAKTFASKLKKEMKTEEAHRALSTAQELAEEWGELYAMAKKQSLVGVCFAGVQKLVVSEKEDYCGMNELQKRLSADGFRNYIMKG